MEEQYRFFEHRAGTAHARLRHNASRDDSRVADHVTVMLHGDGVSNQQASMGDWGFLAPEQQTAFRIEYGHYPEGPPPTCSPQGKVQRFRASLRGERGIKYSD
jgi:hypothetical protein